MPNLVARTTRSRWPLIAWPTSSSFVKATVDVGGVEEGDAELERAMDGGDRLAVVALAVEVGHAHAAEREGGDFRPWGQECAFHELAPLIFG